MSDRVARAALSRLAEPGDIRLAGLVAELGAGHVYDLLLNEQDVAGVYTDVASRLRGLDPARELADAAARGIRFVCPGDAEWPSSVGALDGCEDVNGRGGAPLGLWVRGPLSLAEAADGSVAVVGSRSATSYGAGVAADIAADLGKEGVCVTSGAAFGIDQAAHRGALASRGPTIAVLACGVDRAYPSAHKNLLDYIADVGAVVSELPPGCAPTKFRFLSRNRLIAALSAGVVVVEAAVRSGALNTANWATRLHRPLMGVPGPVTSAPSEGVHELLRRGDAILVTCGRDVLELVSPAGSFLADVRRAPERPRDRLDARTSQVLDAVPVLQAVSADSIARTAGLGEREVRVALDQLFAKGLVERSGALWRLVQQDGASG